MQEDFSGQIEQETDDGKIVISFLQGKKQGVSKFINRDGVVLSEIPYENDEIHGELRQYYTTGNLMAIMTYQHNVLSGKFITFFENGMKRFETCYENGLFNGKFVTFDEFGDKVSESLYNNGEKFGESIIYYPKSQGGKVLEISNYNEKGLLTGNRIQLYPTGEVMSITPYIDGKAQAYTKNYSKDGNEIQ